MLNFQRSCTSNTMKLLLLLLFTSAVVADIFCDLRWLPFENKCYKVYMDSKGHNFNDAQAICEAENGTLAILDSPGVAELIYDLLKHKDDLGYTFLNQPWIGYKKDEANNWTWMDGTKNDANIKWAPGEPNNKQGKQSCARLVTNHIANGRSFFYGGQVRILDDSNCEGKAPRFACQKKSGEQPVFGSRIQGLPVNDILDCGMPGVYGLKDTNSCYKHHIDMTNFVNYTQASDICSQTGGILVTITSEVEQTFVRNLANLGSKAHPWEQPWIGLRHKNKVWEWEDGSKQQPSWAKDYPSNTKLADNCGQLVGDEMTDAYGKVILDRSHLGQVVDYPCSYKTNSFICKMPVKTFLSKNTDKKFFNSLVPASGGGCAEACKCDCCQ